GHLGQEGLATGFGDQLLAQLCGDLAQAGLMDDHHASRPLGDQGGHLSEQAAADVDVVTAGGGGDGDNRGTHSVSYSGPDGRSSCRVLTMVRATCAGPP